MYTVWCTVRNVGAVPKPCCHTCTQSCHMSRILLLRNDFLQQACFYLCAAARKRLLNRKRPLETTSHKTSLCFLCLCDVHLAAGNRDTEQTHQCKQGQSPSLLGKSSFNYSTVGKKNEQTLAICWQNKVFVGTEEHWHTGTMRSQAMLS